MTTAAEMTPTTDAPPVFDGAAQDSPIHRVICMADDCGAKVTYRPTSSGNGFQVLERIGVGLEADFEIGENGRPMCPRGHGEMAFADEQLPAADAIRQVGERLAEGEAVQRSLPGIVPEFNWKGAYLELESMAVEVDALHAQAKEDAETARESKKHWEKRAETFQKMGLEFRRRRREKAEGPSNTETPGITESVNRCRFIQLNPNEDQCPLCESSTDESHEYLLKTLGVDALAARESELHAVQARDVRARWEADDIQSQLEDVDFYVSIAAILDWSTEQRAAAKAWSDGAPVEGPPPDVLGRPHIASTAVEGESTDQRCTVCGSVLLVFGDADVDDDPYPDGARVGIDCPGAAQEPARQVRRHKKAAPAKKGRKK